MGCFAAPRSKRDLEAFFARCIAATATDVRKALPLLVKGPDYVERCASKLGAAYPDMRFRSLALLATGLGMFGCTSLTEEAFRLARSVAGVSAWELAGLDAREALIDAKRGRWQKALNLANAAVVSFEGREGPGRDDCSLPFARAARGLIHGYGFQHGACECSPEEALRDFQAILERNDEGMPMTRRAAVSGICAVSVVLWMTGLPTPRNATPISVVETMTRFRAQLRREGTPWRSLVDAKARWILALATFRLLGHLGHYAERHIRYARDVLTEVGTAQDVREITLDLQWCLLADNDFERALDECAVLEACGESPGVVSGMALFWRDALTLRRLTPRIIEQVYGSLRGIPGVVSPLPPEDIVPRRRIAIGTGCRVPEQPYGF